MALPAVQRIPGLSAEAERALLEILNAQRAETNRLGAAPRLSALESSVMASEGQTYRLKGGGRVTLPRARIQNAGAKVAVLLETAGTLLVTADGGSTVNGAARFEASSIGLYEWESNGNGGWFGTSAGSSSTAAAGAPGAAGADGATGGQGQPGARGADGRQGFPGPQGLQGIQGLQGPPGVRGTDGSRQFFAPGFINLNQIINSLLADMPARTVKANPTNATGDPQDVQGSTARQAFVVNDAATGLEWRFPNEIRDNSNADNGDAFSLRFSNGTNTTSSVSVAAGVATISYSVTGIVGVTDGDKGDITVSSGGTVWTVDADISKAWAGTHLFTGAFDVDVAGNVTVTAGNDGTGTLTLQGNDGFSAGGAEMRLASAAVIESTGTFRVSTAGTERLEIRTGGAWELNDGNTGTNGQVFTSTGGSTPPDWTNPTGSRRNFYRWFEDFETFQPAAGAGALGLQVADSTTWARTATLANGTLSCVDSEADHPGILRFESTATGTSCMHRSRAVANTTSATLRGDQILEFEVMARLSSASSNKFLFGFSEDPSSTAITGTTVSNIIAFIFDSASDGTVHCITREADGTAVDTDSNIAPTAATWRRYTIRQTTLGTIEFLIDGSVVATHNSQVPDTEAMVCAITHVTTTASTRQLDIDYVSFESQPLSR